MTEVVDLKTSRLTIRPFRMDDAAFILKLLNEPNFIENIADKGVRNIQAAENYLRDGPMTSYERFGFGLWRVGLHNGDTPIGMAGLLKRDYLDDIDIGYALLPEYCGSGYAFEAASAVMDYARGRLKAKRVLALVKPDNQPSVGLLEKLGFEDNGAIRPPEAKEDARLFVAAGMRS